MGFLPWEIRVAFPGESQLRQSRATQPTVHAGCSSVSIIHRTLTWTTGSLTCAQMLMHAIAHEGVRTPKESLHWKLTLGENSLPHRGIEFAWAVCRFDVLPTELHPLGDRTFDNHGISAEGTLNSASLVHHHRMQKRKTTENKTDEKQGYVNIY